MMEVLPYVCSGCLYQLLPLWVCLRFAWVWSSPSLSNNLTPFTASTVTGECWIPKTSSICFLLIQLLDLLAITQELQKEMYGFEYLLPSSSVVFIHSLNKFQVSVPLSTQYIHSNPKLSILYSVLTE